MATNVSDFYDLEARVGAGVLTVLQTGVTAILTANIMRPRSTVEAACPRIEYRFLNMQRASTQHGHALGGAFYHDHWTAELELSLVTDRTASATQNHGLIRGRMRYLMSKEASRFISPTVTFFQVLDIEATGTAYEVEQDEREDISRMAYRFEFVLNDSAYPELPP